MNAQDTELTAEIFGGPIDSYGRGEAIADGYLVDVTETAREAGLSFPVALTRVAWENCVAWSDDDSARKHWPQDQAGRLWDVLSMARFFMRGAVRRNPAADRFAMQVLRVPREGRGVKARVVTLLVVIGPGDDAEPVITIGLPHDF